MSRDPGLQPERTRLAWRRTLLAVTAILLLELRLAFTGRTFDAVLAGFAVVAWLGVLVVDWRRATGSGPRRVGRWSIPLTALAAAGLALLGVLHVVRGLR
ncbi:DUF202 domain-containing protein [Micromonospora chaiyaphumensis]|uniref:DUF202 domain-containing protein n=1 Tax=Micromonospora chaiyaphumensis TaxID=307119 RepID=A0A1C4YZT0_9ACTN|nr:DUF202 domain-containing protein [Micromonospora chaiyaphumensis]SCF26174.1 protein of unknown function [Micromonospora chaiyaphumensis]